MDAALRIYGMDLRRTVVARTAGWLGPALLAALLVSAAGAQDAPDCTSNPASIYPADSALRQIACDAQDHPANLELRVRYARALALAHRYNDALNQYQYVLQQNPENARARFGVAKIMSWQSRFDVAEEMYDQLLRDNPGYYDAMVGRAFNLLWMGEKDRAREALLACRAVHPDDTEVITALKALGVTRLANEGRAETGSARGARRLGGSGAPGSSRDELSEPAGDDLGPVSTTHVPTMDEALTWLMAYRPLLTPLATGLFLFAGFFGLRDTIRQIRVPIILAGLKAAKAPILLAASSVEQKVNRNTVYRPPPRPAMRPAVSPAHPRVSPARVTPRAAAAPAVQSPPAAAPVARAAAGQGAVAPPVAAATTAPRVRLSVTGAPIAQGGTSSVAPPPVSTATTNFTQPVRPAVPVQVVSDAKPAEAPKRVLVAEDEKPVLDFVRETLEAAGVHVIACERGADALEHLRDRAFDAIIADAALPGVPGNELYCWLAENQPGAENRLMLALPHSADEKLQRFIDKTGVLCINRPFAVPDLVVMTRLLLERSRLRSAPPN